MARESTGTKHAQSAMEYLMTYGWAILIIAVVLGALFELGFFNSANLAPKVPPGSCQVYRPQGPGTTAFESLEGTCNNELPQYTGQFDGVNSNINIPYNPIDDIFNGGSFTISMWIKANDPPPIEGLYAQQYNTIDEQLLIQGTSGEPYVEDPGSWAYSDINVFDNRWHYLAVTFSSTGANTITFYLDGKYDGSGSGALFVPQATQFYIGTDRLTGAFFSGSIANVQVYNTSLSTNEIQAIYQEGIGGVPLDLNNLVGWWPLNGNANDYSGNQNNGVPGNVIFTTSWASSYSAP